MSTNRHPIEEEKLMAYLDGELPEDQGSQAWAHLEVCSQCQTLAADFRSVSQELMAWEVESPEVGISSAIDLALREHLEKREAREVNAPGFGSTIVTTRWVWAGALAIVCVAVGLRLMLASHDRNEDRSTGYPSMASIPSNT